MQNVKLEQSQPAWISERARVLERICRAIRRKAERGESEIKLLKQFAFQFKNRALNADKSRRLRLSFPTLRRIYYRWKSGSQAAFALNYTAPRRTPAEVQEAFLAACLMPKVQHYSAAGRLAGKALAGNRAFTVVRSLPVAHRERVRRLFAVRRAQRRALIAEHGLRRVLAKVCGVNVERPTSNVEHRTKAPRMPQDALEGINLPTPARQSKCKRFPAFCKASSQAV